ncbi:hypothetical protein C8N35_109148 [Breoghania corrubedonensis]|uniref:Uncharacterized protein n=1 Tax=Breoghania corrubedonensis TaxID=665038 RepID=A0A2T5V535_9HYPH|nr:hypothetical protein [Breoghania corrubedonensis]PTW58843.1 hypothetical protein C8N35_109148 [Breoghania corrubedonensis]
MDKKQLDSLKIALKEAKIDELLIDRFIDGALRTCNEACWSGCAACCSSGTANRLAQ